MMGKIRFWAVTLLATFISFQAAAAPFCAVFSYGKQCYYYTLQACQQAAGSSGACVVNNQGIGMSPSGGAPFCVVQSYGAQCFYYDAQACRKAASSSGGACVVNPNR